MNHDDELGRLLGGAFDAKARARVGDQRPVPPLELHTTHRTPRTGRRPVAWLAPLAAAAAVVAVVVGLAFAAQSTSTTSGHPQQHVAVGPSSSGTASVSPTPTHSATTAAKSVHVKLKFSDGSRFGVGIPIIAYLSRRITDGTAFAKATTVTVDGQPADGAWYFESSGAEKGYPLEAHYRLKDYWPAHSKIHMDLPVAGLSAGTGLAFDDSLTLDFSTGAANIATVDDSTHTLTLVRDGKKYGTYPVSLGATNTPTARGTKVIMEKGLSICMSGPGYHECGVKYTQRLTYGGEYLHAAPWNLAHLGNFDSSNGCTNLSTSDAAALYKLLEIGDVVTYPNATGPKMQMGQGYGDWNVAWSQWLTGGAVRTA
jgi:lipoprotein-anchoring transpeptidase ErfK/SrfK